MMDWEIVEQKDMETLEGTYDPRWDLYKQGLSDSEIARQLGVYSSTIGHWRKVRNLPSNRVEIIDAFNEEIKEMIDGGYTVKEISETLEIPYSSVFMALQRNDMIELQRQKVGDFERSKEYAIKRSIRQNFINLCKRNKDLCNKMAVEFKRDDEELYNELKIDDIVSRWINDG